MPTSPATATIYRRPTLSPTPTASPSAPLPRVRMLEIPDTPVGQRLAWVLDTCCAAGGTRPGRGRRQFHREFLAQVPATNLLAGLVDFRQNVRRDSLCAVQRSADGSQATEAPSDSDPARHPSITIAATESTPHRISGYQSGSIRALATPILSPVGTEFDRRSPPAPRRSTPAAERIRRLAGAVHALNAEHAAGPRLASSGTFWANRPIRYPRERALGRHWPSTPEEPAERQDVG